MRFEFPVDYPFKGPNVHFQCRMYHPNVDDGRNVYQSDQVGCMETIYQGLGEYVYVMFTPQFFKRFYSY